MTNSVPEGSGDQPREFFWLSPVILLVGTVVSAPTRIAGDPRSNPGPGKRLSLKLTTYAQGLINIVDISSQS